MGTAPAAARPITAGSHRRDASCRRAPWRPPAALAPWRSRILINFLQLKGGGFVPPSLTWSWFGAARYGRAQRWSSSRDARPTPPVIELTGEPGDFREDVQGEGRPGRPRSGPAAADRPGQGVRPGRITE